MMVNNLLGEIADALRNHQRFVVMSHVRPDGDALGCHVAVALCLRQLGKDVTAWNQDGIPERLRYLPGSEIIQMPPTESQEFDVAIVLDTAVRDRAGTCLEGVRSAKLWINIDHHVTNNRYGDLAHVDPTAPATGQILFELFHENDLPLTYAMADNLFVAIS